MSQTEHASPTVEALRAAIESSAATLEEAPRRSPNHGEGLLFLGVWSDALPRLLIEDPVLAPTDKIVWQVIRLHARADGATAFPGYATVGRLANVRAQATIARAIAMLRISRWLTLCARVRDAQGRFRGNVYALHDEPLPLGDTLHLDCDYMHFLDEASEHRHGRVRAVAVAARATIEDGIQHGHDVTQAPRTIERRVEATQTVHGQAQGGFYSFNQRRLGEIQRSVSEISSPDAPTSESEHGSPPHSDGPGQSGILLAQEICEPGGSTSSSRTLETTTTPESSCVQEISTRDLVLPQRLSPNHQTLARLYVERAPPNLRQPVLDELEGRLRAERRGAPPVYDPLRFLKRLCDAALSGDFVPNLGVDVQAERERERRAEQQMAHPPSSTAVTLPPADPNNRLVQMALRMQEKQRARQDSKERTDDDVPGNQN